MNDEEDDYTLMHLGSASVIREADSVEPPTSFEMQHGVLVPKNYQRNKRPIGFIWSD